MSAGTLRGNVELDLTSLRATAATAVQVAKGAGQAMADSLKVVASVDAQQPVKALGAVSDAAGAAAASVKAMSGSAVNIDTRPAEKSIKELIDDVEAYEAIAREASDTPINVRVNNAQSIRDASNAVQQLLSPLGLLPGHLGAVAARGAAMASSLSSMAGGLGGASGAAGTLSGSLAALAPALSAAAPAIAAVGAAALAAAPFVAGFGLSIAALNSTPVQLAAAMEQTKIAFTTLTGSAANAEATLKDLRAFADTTPFEFPEIASAAKQLLAMGIGAGEVTDSLRMLGDISSGLGQPLGEMAYLFGQIRSQGRAMTQDLNQFAGRGVPIYSALADVLHTNEAGVRAFAEAGKIGFAEVQAALQALTSEGGKFAGLTAAQSQSLSGLQSTAADAFGSMLTQIGDVLILNLGLKDSVKSVSDLIVASTPVIVGLFDNGSKALAPFADLARALVNTVGELMQGLTAAGDIIHTAIGDEGVAAFDEILATINPIRLALDGLIDTLQVVAAVVRTVREAIEDVNFLISGEAQQQEERNRRPISKEEVAAGRKERSTGGTPVGTSTVGGGGTGGGGSAVNADKDLGAGGGDFGPTAADLKAEAKAVSDSLARAEAANAKAAADTLRAAGRDVEARLLEINQRYKGELGRAKTPEEFDALERARVAEITAVQADAAETAAKAKQAAEQRQATQARETAKRTAAYQIDTTATVLEAQGRMQEAQLLRFDAQWQERIALIKDAGERAAAMDNYAAERVKKISDAANKGGGSGAADALAAPRTSQQERQDFQNEKGDFNQRFNDAIRGGARPSEVRAIRRQKQDALQRSNPANQPGARNAVTKSGDIITFDRADDPARPGGGLPSLASPLQAIAPTLNPVMPPGAAAGRTPGGSPAINVNASAAIDPKAVTSAVVEVLKPYVDRRLREVEQAARDRNYAGAVGRGY